MLTMVLLVSLSVVIYLPIYAAFKLILLPFVLFYGWRLIRQVLLLDNHSVLRLRYENSDHWCLTMANLSEQTAVLRGDSIVTQGMLLLRFNTDKRVISCIIFKDAMCKERYRQLLVLLRVRLTG
ncbi:MAG: protein YgfX [Gammaproteobacteria bacterium]